MLTKAADSDLVVKLINQVQIFRFATKPIRTGALQLAVSAAMKEHKRFRTAPSLLKRYGVAPSRELEDATLAASVLKSLSGPALAAVAHAALSADARAPQQRAEAAAPSVSRD